MGGEVVGEVRVGGGLGGGPDTLACGLEEGVGGSDEPVVEGEVGGGGDRVTGVFEGFEAALVEGARGDQDVGEEIVDGGDAVEGGAVLERDFFFGDVEEVFELRDVAGWADGFALRVGDGVGDDEFLAGTSEGDIVEERHFDEFAVGVLVDGDERMGVDEVALQVGKDGVFGDDLWELAFESAWENDELEVGGTGAHDGADEDLIDGWGNQAEGEGVEGGGEKFGELLEGTWAGVGEEIFEHGKDVVDLAEGLFVELGEGGVGEGGRSQKPEVRSQKREG